MVGRDPAGIQDGFCNFTDKETEQRRPGLLALHPLVPPSGLSGWHPAQSHSDWPAGHSLLSQGEVFS